MVWDQDRIIAGLRGLTSHDFDEMNPTADGPERLYALCDEMTDRATVLSCADAVFETMERLGDSDLGSPGPLVHTLESTVSEYRPFLADSVRRKPVPLTIWMVNRILNIEHSDRDFWLDLLKTASTREDASAITRDDAREFLARHS